MAKKILLRGDTKANWLSVDPVLSEREAVIETDGNLFKIGDGVKKYSELPYANGGSGNVDAGVLLANSNKYSLIGEKLGYKNGMIRSGRIPKKVVFIGNSMTAHAYNGTLGWTVSDFREMATSRPDTGWVTLVTKHLKYLNSEVEVYKANGANWESQALGTKSYLTIKDNDVWGVTENGTITTEYKLDDVLDSNVDAIIVQLYENIPDTTGNPTDCVSLVNDYGNLYASLRLKCPNAKLYQFCGFWQTEGKNSSVISACGKFLVEPIHATILMWPRTGAPAYPNNFKSSQGDIIYDSNGSQIATVSSSVAGHPSDFGFAAMAAYTIFSLYNSAQVLDDSVKRFILKTTVSMTEEQLKEIWLDNHTDITGDLYLDGSVSSLAQFSSVLDDYLKYLFLGGRYNITCKMPMNGPATEFIACHSFFEIITNGICNSNYIPAKQKFTSVTSGSLVDVIRKTNLTGNSMTWNLWSTEV